jgi:hypothetical protein
MTRVISMFNRPAHLTPDVKNEGNHEYAEESDNVDTFQWLEIEYEKTVLRKTLV